MDKAKIRRTRDELKSILTHADPMEPLIPGFVAAAKDPSLAQARPATSMILEAARPYLDDIDTIPALTYTKYRDVQRYTDRMIYRVPQMEKRAKMSAAALKVLLGDDTYLNALYDYIWSTCEESKWILPQREDLEIDLRVAGTGFMLAEILVAMGDKLEPRIVKRVREEIDRRVFTRYLSYRETWYKSTHNWNGVCNGGVGAMFLLLEEDVDRLAHGLEIVLDALDVFVNQGFGSDGASGEGVGYWHYGLTNFTYFAELLRRRTGGEIDLLASDRMKVIAQYPVKVMLSPGRFFSYSDSHEHVAFHPGLVQRLAERTGVDALLGVLAEPAELRAGFAYFHRVWRAMMWWDGTRPEKAGVSDSLLEASKVARLTNRTPSGAPVVLATKAEENAVNHNHNDVGVFVLHADGETFICDPESGHYDQYKIQGRYNVPFAGSYGHSVPRFGEIEQSAGEGFEGEITAYEVDGGTKRVELDLEDAYEVPGLERVHRMLRLGPTEMVLEDAFTFSGEALPVEEAVVTWCNTMVEGRTALLIGERHILELTLEAPADAAFDLEVLAEASELNSKAVPLKRLSFVTHPDQDGQATARVRAVFRPA
jgi:hypothetical protein